MTCPEHEVKLEELGGTVYGSGRDELLRMTGEGQSLNAVARKLHVSYRLVWGKIKDAEERLGIDLVEIDPYDRRMHLTKEARMLLKISHDMEAEILPILKKAERSFCDLQMRAAARKRF
jgi:molybdate transport system regulatory protein